MDNNIKEIKDDLKEIKIFLFEWLEKKYANKWTEKVLIFIGWTIWTTIIIAILALVLKK
jgi:hypothetical protein